jgi:hypothetical protein
VSTIFRDTKGRGIDHFSRTHQDEKCHVCDRVQAVAYWMCGSPNDIAVCYYCAVHVLPALIADAMRGTVCSNVVRTHAEMDARFWRAAAIALGREPTPAEVEEMKSRQCMECIDLEMELKGTSPH